MSRKYDSNFRKKLVIKLQKLTHKQNLIDIYNIISDNEFSSNMNGLFYNINSFPDACIELLSKYTQETTTSTTYKQIVYTQYSNDVESSLNKTDQQIINKMKTLNANL